MPRYSEGFRERVRVFVCSGHSPTDACREFPGPSVAAVYSWLGYRPPHARVHDPAACVGASGAKRRFRPSWKLKRAIALRHVRDGGRMAGLAASTGYLRTVLYHWVEEIPGRRIARPS